MKHMFRRINFSLISVTKCKMYHKTQRKAVFCVLLTIVTILILWTRLNLHSLVIRSAEQNLKEGFAFPSNNVPLTYMTQQEPDIRARCFRYPQYVHLKFNNLQWQVLDGFRKQYFFYGAYFDNRYVSSDIQCCYTGTVFPSKPQHTFSLALTSIL